MAAVQGQGKPNAMTTERIQEILEENFKYIKAIAEQQNLGRVQEVNQYQAKLQENLMLLAAVADTYAPPASASSPATAQTAGGAPAARPSGPAPALGAAAAAGQYAGATVQQQQQPMAMAGQQSAQLTQQQVQQLLARQQQLQQQQQFQLPQNGIGAMPMQGQASGGYQLPAPPPLNLGM